MWQQLDLDHSRRSARMRRGRRGHAVTSKIFTVYAMLGDEGGSMERLREIGEERIVVWIRISRFHVLSILIKGLWKTSYHFLT